MGALLKNVFACRAGGFSEHLASVATMLKSYLIKPSQKCWKPFYKHKIQMGPQNDFTNLNKNSSQFAPKCRDAVSHKWAFKRGLNCWDYIRTECLLVWNTVMFLSTNSLVVTFVYERECARRSIIATSLLFAFYSWRAAFEQWRSSTYGSKRDWRRLHDQ